MLQPISVNIKETSHVKMHSMTRVHINIHFHPMWWMLWLCQPADLWFTPAGVQHHEARLKGFRRQLKGRSLECAWVKWWKIWSYRESTGPLWGGDGVWRLDFWDGVQDLNQWKTTVSLNFQCGQSFLWWHWDFNTQPSSHVKVIYWATVSSHVESHWILTDIERMGGKKL